MGRRKSGIEALTLKSGPTESGVSSPSPSPVGGEIIPIDKLSLLLSHYWLFLILLLLPFGFLLYKKRHFILRLLLR